MFGSAERPDIIKQVVNNRTEKQEFFVCVSCTLGLNGARDRVLLYPNASMREKRADGSIFFNPFKELGEKLRANGARLAISSIHVIYAFNDLEVPITMEIRDLFSTDSVYGTNMPAQVEPVRKEPDPEAHDSHSNLKGEDKEQPEPKEEDTKSGVFNSAAPETTNTVYVYLAPKIATPIEADEPMSIYRSIVKVEQQLSHGGYDAVYRTETIKTQTFDEEGQPSDADSAYQLYDETHPIVSDLRRCGPHIGVELHQIRKVKVEDAVKFRVERDADHRIKEFILHSVFQNMRYTDFSDTSMSALYMRDSVQEELNARYLEDLKARGGRGYHKCVHFVLQINAVQVNPGVSENHIKTIILENL